MIFWYFLIGAILLIAAFPYIRYIFKRITCFFKIRKICRNKNYKLFKTHFFWFSGSKHAKKCDFHIETENEIYSVKLFGVPRRMTALVFKENGDYYIRSFIAFISNIGLTSRIPINGKIKTMPTYNFRYNYKDEWEIKIPHKILLVNPVSMEFRRQPRNGPEIMIGAGDTVNGMEIHSLSRFLGALETAI